MTTSTFVFQMTSLWSVAALMLVSTLVLTTGQSCNHLDEVVKANSRFAIDLYQRIGADTVGMSMIFSPWSVSTALAMTYHGANGNTEYEMDQALRFYGMGATCLAESGFLSLINLLNAASTISTANRIYIDNSVSLNVSSFKLNRIQIEFILKTIDFLA